MARKKIEKEEEVVVKVKEVKEKASVKTEVSIFDGRNVVRTYSKEVHGDNFEDLAKQFISDRPNYSLK